MRMHTKPPLFCSVRWILSTWLVMLVCMAGFCRAADEPIDIGSRLELFVDDYLIDQTTGDVDLHLHKPTPREVVLVTDKPWEGNTSLYYTVFQDDGRYRMYYRGSHSVEPHKSAHREVTCYAESRDGIHWVKPELDLFEWDGSRKNNIIVDGVGSHNFTPFIDRRADCPPDEKYKALGRGLRTPDGGDGTVYKIFAFKSADGIHWSRLQEEPVLTKGRFDSQNVAFWSPIHQQYLSFSRNSRSGYGRAVQVCSSKDFRHWDTPVWLEYTNARPVELYTNAIQLYYRSPHIFIGFPSRFFSKLQYPERPDEVEPLLTSSRDGRNFRLWLDPVIPRTATEGRTGNRSNYMGWGLVQLPHSDQEVSVYATEGHRRGQGSRLRRFAYRVDGFVSVRALATGGELRNKPLVFEGNQLVINFATLADDGSLRVEIQDAEGKPLPGFSLADSVEIAGDRIDQVVSWKKGVDVGALAGKPICLRFVLRKVDLYSIRFQ